MKLLVVIRIIRAVSRAPHGARGLKYVLTNPFEEGETSRPARGAWIEMTLSGVYYLGHEVAPRTGRVD